MHKKAKAIIALVAAAGGVVSVSSSASATTTAESALTTSSGAVTFTITAPASASNATTAPSVGPHTDVETAYSCTLTVNNPHWSTGTGGVIAKITALCGGPQDLNVEVDVDALLGKTQTNNVSTLNIVAENNKTQNVLANSGQKTTWYVPAATSTTQIAANAYFRASASAEIVAPGVGPINEGASTFLYVSH